MMDRVTIGQYIPGNSFVHRLDPRIKICLVVLYMLMIFFVSTYWGYLAYALCLGLTLLVSRVPFVNLLRGLRPILLLIVLTSLINLFTTSDGRELFHIWVFRATDQGVSRMIFIVIRITLLVAGTSMLTLTTSPLSLTDGLESLLKPLRAVHFPVHELALMISIALRFIPTLFEETDKIMRAQKARGADFESGSILSRARAMIPLMVPLFINAFRRADELAVAMEARCYRGGEGRTRLNPLRMRGTDVQILVLGNLFLIAVGILL